MKIYAFSDTHGNLEDLDPTGCDICVIAGDFSKMTGWGKWHLYDQKKWIQKKFLTFTGKYPEIQFILVPGNHDLCMDHKFTTAHKDLMWEISWPTNVHTLINSGITINNVKFYGSPQIPIINYSWAFEAENDKLEEVFARIPDDIDVLITHSPPRIPDSYVDISTQYGARGPFGSAELTNAIMRVHPKLVFCGHIHSGQHGEIEFDGTKIFNVSRVDEDYNIGYEPTIVEI